MLKRALICVLAGMLCGCTTIFKPDQDVFYGPDFFSCNYWIDRNQDGKIAIDEWEGVKDCFFENEHVCFVAYFRQKPGTPLSFRLISPDGTVHSEKKLKQTAKTTIWCQEYEARNLVRAKGYGIWKVEWYAGDRLVNITTIRIYKIPTD
ncbi:MAG: hypothetical protein NC913_00050 [Candidatus Omnitrophica bacterium]|nr:hypothetical protein [Candidatus Omnitrophota bacterium]